MATTEDYLITFALLTVVLAILVGGAYLLRKYGRKAVQRMRKVGNESTPPTTGEKPRAQSTVTTTRWYWVIVLVVHALMYVPGLFLGPIIATEALTLSYWHVVLFIQVVYDYLSFTRVTHIITKTQEIEGEKIKTTALVVGQGPNEVGALYAFGFYICGTGSGLVYAPLFIIEHRRDSVLVQQTEIPGDLPSRYTDPETGTPLQTLRMTTSPASKNTTSKDVQASVDENDGTQKKGTDEEVDVDPLATGRLTLEVAATISYRLSRDPANYRRFVESVGSIDEFLQIADDEVITSLRREIALATPSEVFVQWKEIEARVKQSLIDRFGNLGFDDLDLNVKEFGLPKRVNEALADRTKENIAVGTERLKGEQAKQRDTRIAQANRALAAANLQGIIDAFRLANPGMELTEGQLLVLAHQSMLQTTLPTTQHTAYGLGVGGLLDPNVANLLTGLNSPANNKQTDIPT